MIPSVFVLLLAATMVGPGGTPNPEAMPLGLYPSKAECEADRKILMTELAKKAESDHVTRYGSACVEVKLDAVPLKKKEASQ